MPPVLFPLGADLVASPNSSDGTGTFLLVWLTFCGFPTVFCRNGRYPFSGGCGSGCGL